MTITDLISAEFEIGKEPENVLLWRLDVLNQSDHRLELLIAQIDYELVQILNIGDCIKDMMLYTEWAMIKTDVTVRHIKKVSRDTQKDRYILGVESMELLKL